MTSGEDREEGEGGVGEGEGEGEGGGGGGGDADAWEVPLAVSAPPICFLREPLGPLPSSTSRLLSRVIFASWEGDDKEAGEEDSGARPAGEGPVELALGAGGESAWKVCFENVEKEMDIEMCVDALTNPVQRIFCDFVAGAAPPLLETEVGVVKLTPEMLVVDTPLTVVDECVISQETAHTPLEKSEKTGSSALLMGLGGGKGAGGRMTQVSCKSGSLTSTAAPSSSSSS